MSETLETLGIEEMAKIVRKTPKTVSEDVTRRPESLPPRLIIPNSRGVLWRKIDVEQWLADRVQKPIGRPRKYG